MGNLTKGKGNLTISKASLTNSKGDLTLVGRIRDWIIKRRLKGDRGYQEWLKDWRLSGKTI